MHGHIKYFITNVLRSHKNMPCGKLNVRKVLFQCTNPG